MAGLARRSQAADENRMVVERKRLARENNLAWIERAMGDSPIGDLGNRSLILLVGGDDPLSFRLRVAQSHVRDNLSPSAWSLALFLGPLNPSTRLTQTFGISLAPPDWYPPFGYAPSVNAIQRGRLDRYASATLFPNIALLAVPVDRAAVETSIEDLQRERTLLDLPMLVLKWLQYAWGVGVPASPLGDGFGMPSAAMLEAAFAANGFDLTPGLESRSSCPEAIWQAARWWHEYYAKHAAGSGDGADGAPQAIAGAYSALHLLVPD